MGDHRSVLETMSTRVAVPIEHHNAVDMGVEHPPCQQHRTVKILTGLLTDQNC